jgi:hypothetical protein
MTTQFGYAEDPESPETVTPVAPAETSRSLSRALKEDAPPFMFAGAIVVGLAALSSRIFGKGKGRARRIARRLVKR